MKIMVGTFVSTIILSLQLLLILCSYLYRSFERIRNGLRK